MKNMLKNMIGAVSSKINELKIRIIIFFLLHKNTIHKDFLSHTLNKTKKNDDVLEVRDGGTHLLMSYNNNDKDPELTHALFVETEAALEAEAAAEETVADAAAEEEEEEDIDHAADLFIQRFKRQIQLQKQHSLEKILN